MILKNIKLKNFRNFKNEEITPDKGVNVIYGENAQGKTNLLESIWLCGGGHSFRGAKESELINFDSDKAEIEANFFAQGYEQSLKINYGGDKKEVFINGVLRNGAALSEKFSVVVFSPEHMTLVKNGPAERRKFLDGAIARYKLKYASLLVKFNKTLRQRNALLKDIYAHPELEEILPVWDSSLSALCAQLVFERKQYILKLSEEARKLHFGISGGKEELSVHYSSPVKYEDFEKDADFIAAAKEKYFKTLQKNRSGDIRFGTTQAGPHRDDMEIFLSGTAARNFGSQGQQRSIVISLKLAEAALMREMTGEEPVIILDDVLSELDKGRQEFLLSKIKNNQVFLSCCETIDKEQFSDVKFFHIENAEIN